MYIILSNITGLPSINVPVGIDKNGIPFGLRIIGNAFAEANLFAFYMNSYPYLGSKWFAATYYTLNDVFMSCIIAYIHFSPKWANKTRSLFLRHFPTINLVCRHNVFNLWFKRFYHNYLIFMDRTDLF